MSCLVFQYYKKTLKCCLDSIYRWGPVYWQYVCGLRLHRNVHILEASFLYQRIHVLYIGIGKRWCIPITKFRNALAHSAFNTTCSFHLMIRILWGPSFLLKKWFASVARQYHSLQFIFLIIEAYSLGGNYKLLILTISHHCGHVPKPGAMTVDCPASVKLDEIIFVWANLKLAKLGSLISVDKKYKIIPVIFFV